MPEHTFMLVIRGDVDAHIDELFEAGCDDATFSGVDGVNFADFDREAPSLAQAIASAVEAIESVPGLQVARVEPDDLVSQAEIADRLGRSRESVRLLVVGERGAGFPQPVSHFRARTRLWRWSDVAAWAETTGAHEQTAANVIAAANGALELRNRSQRLTAGERQLLEGLAR